MTRWWEGEKSEWENESYARKVKARSEFMEQFAYAAGEKMMDAKRAGERAAARSEAERTGQTGAEATDSVALVVRSRTDRVQEWYDEHYGKSLRTVSRRYRETLSYDAQAAGRAAGLRADVGQPSVKGRRGLER